MKIALGADHRGVGYKNALAEKLRAGGHEVADLGTHDTEPTDYPDVAMAVAKHVVSGASERGILVCGSAVGVSVAANKVRGARAATCHDPYSAAQGVRHDDMNILCMGELVIGWKLAWEVTAAFLGATFSDEPRFQRRLDKVLAAEAKT